MAHRWLPHEVSETIDIALTTQRGSRGRAVAAEELADRITRDTPRNPLTPSAAATAILAACFAIDGNYGMAAEELQRQIKRRRDAGVLVRKNGGGGGQTGVGSPAHWRRALPADERVLDHLISICLVLPPGEDRTDAARGIAPDHSIGRALPMIDDAIDGRYPVREVLSGLKRLTMLRRAEGTLVRVYPWVPVAANFAAAPNFVSA